MKKFLVLTAIVCFSLPAFVGCGSGEPEVIEATQESDGSMDASQQAQYEEYMKKGGSSQRPGN